MDLLMFMKSFDFIGFVAVPGFNLSGAVLFALSWNISIS